MTGAGSRGGSQPPIAATIWEVA